MAINISENSFDSEVLNSDIPVLVDFWAPWCGPCVALAPVLDQLSAERSDIKIAKVNVDDNANLSMKFRIQSIPAIMLFHKGAVVASRVGGTTKVALSEWIDENIKK